MNNTDLFEKMIAKSDSDGLPDDHDLRLKAKAFNDAAQGFCASEQTCDIKTFMGTWARARKAWCDYSGEPLI